MLAVVEFADVLPYGCSADACVALHVHVIAERENNLLNLRGELPCRRKDEGLGVTEGDINGLKDADGECSRFTSAGLSLRDDVSALSDGDDGPLLDSGGFLKVWGLNEGSVK